MGYFLVLLCSLAFGLGVKCNTRILIIWKSWSWQCLGKTVLIIYSSVIHSRPTLCDHMECSMAGFPDHHQHWELAQTHVHRDSDAIQLSYPLLSPSPPVCKISQHQNLYQWVLCIRWPEYWCFNFSISPSNECSGLISFTINWFALLAVQGTLKSLPSTTVQKHQLFSAQPSLLLSLLFY